MHKKGTKENTLTLTQQCTANDGLKDSNTRPKKLNVPTHIKRTLWPGYTKFLASQANDLHSPAVDKTNATDLAKKLKKRKRFDYKQNATAALRLFVDDRKLNQLMGKDRKMLEVSAENILHHAAMRVDLFFYTLIAYYKTGLSPALGNVIIQYGKGRTTKNGKCITQACHSSFFGAFQDNGFLNNTHFLRSLNSTVELPVSFIAKDF